MRPPAFETASSWWPPPSFETLPRLSLRSAGVAPQDEGEPLPRAVAQHEAGAAGAADAAAQRFGGGARVGAHAHLVERLRAAAAQDRAQQTRIAPGEELAVALGERGVVGKRMVAREAGRKLHAPRRRRHQVHALLELLHERIGRAV